MTPRKRRPPQTALQPGQLLDWTDSSHWAYDGPHLCRYCKRVTYLLDDERYPAHKVCAEAALAEKTAQTVAAYREGAL